jgi:hypothetical protein
MRAISSSSVSLHRLKSSSTDQHVFSLVPRSANLSPISSSQLVKEITGEMRGGARNAAVAISTSFTTLVLSPHASSASMMTTIGKTRCAIARRGWWTSFGNCTAGSLSGIEESALKASLIWPCAGEMDAASWYASVRTTLEMLELHCGPRALLEKKLPAGVRVSAQSLANVCEIGDLPRPAGPVSRHIG